MPTPFYHLRAAEDLLRHPKLASQIYSQLDSQRCTFLFGNTATDVQVFSGQNREDTHFFSLPIQPEFEPPWVVLFKIYPSLAYRKLSSPIQIAFIAGYLCHLQADWFWIRDIFLPIFGPANTWGTFRRRLYLHNILRTYLDRIALNQLPSGMGDCLTNLEPSGWLPFVEDEYLLDWSHFLARQLHPGAISQTVEVFSERQGISPEEFYNLLESEDLMEKEVFSHISKQKTVDFQQNLVYENINLLRWYFFDL